LTALWFFCVWCCENLSHEAQESRADVFGDDLPVTRTVSVFSSKEFVERGIPIAAGWHDESQFFYNSDINRMSVNGKFFVYGIDELSKIDYRKHFLIGCEIFDDHGTVHFM